ncbi:MAG: ABC transporter ATP-binding protein [Candidatus Hydrothermarchaeales archaeon]
MPGLIRFTDLSKSFGRIVAVDHVNLEVKKGEIFGIAGPNGAGKTTLVRILCTALKPDSGTVHVNGLDVTKNEVEVKRLIGYLPEEPNLYERLTARRFLDFFGQLYEMEERKERIEEMLELVGIKERADDRISTFSKGMRHRLSLARALLHDPKILVLDEPTMGLDPAVAIAIRELVYAMKGEKTIILCTHYMEEAEKLCNRMAIINHGRVVAIDTPNELKKRAGKGLEREATLDEAFVYYTR